MKLIFKKSFLKAYDELTASQRKKADLTIGVFMSNPMDPRLRNHPLKGNHLGKRAISAGFYLRIVFKVEGDYVRVLMLSVGPHNQAY